MVAIAQVIQGVASGARLPIPDDAPPVVRELMAHCFAEDPAARPTMQQVADSLTAVAPPQLVLPAPASPPGSSTGSSSKRLSVSANAASSSSSERRRKAARRRERGSESAKEQPMEDISTPLVSKEPV